MIRKSDSSPFLFVYGLLKTDYHERYPKLGMDRLKRYDAGQASGTLYDLGDCPAAHFDLKSPNSIVGEIFELSPDSEHLLLLDEFEDVNAMSPLYERIIIPVKTKKESLLCCAYQYLGDRNKPIIESGIF